jgi:hypothetical protein
MARSGNQGLQIALIIFVILTIVLSLTTFLFFKQAEEAEVKSKRDAEASQKAGADLVASLNNERELRRMMGQSEDLTGHPMEKVREQFNLDMAKWATATGGAGQNYSTCMTTLIGSLGEANAERVTQRDQLATLTTQVADERASHERTRSEAVAQATAAAEQLATQTTAWAQRDSDQAAAAEKLKDEKTAIQEQLAAAQLDFEAHMKKKQQEITATEALNEDLTEKQRALQRVTFETSDGEIRWVNQQQGIVWINLGRADNLPKQLQFSVWGRDENDVARSEHKAKIEVTDILGDHLAEARIAEDNIADPILPGDKIYTPLWQPGRQERFAVAGFIDFNKDGNSDVRMLEELIKRNGAAIDALLGEDGKITGPGMTIETRYLVLGVAPEEKAAQEKYSEIRKQADLLGIETITLAKFLDHMGWKDPTQVVEFGLDSDASDFNAVGREGEQRTAPGSTTSGAFRRRNPRQPTGTLQGGAAQED